MRIHSIKVVLLTLLLLSGCQTEKPWWETEGKVPATTETKLGNYYFDFAVQQAGGKYQQAPELSDYVQKLGRRLAAQAKAPTFHYQFVILNQDTPQIFTLPGGKIAISRGLLQEVQSGAELAAILAHQIAHAELGHSTAGKEDRLVMQLADQFMKTPTTATEYPATLNQLLANFTHHTYTAQEEIEADRLAMQYMSKTRMTPEGMLAFLQYISEHPELKQQHPITSERQFRAQYISNQLLTADLSWELESFEKAVTPLRSQASAYAQHMTAIEHLTNKDIKNATIAIEKAIELLPQEGLFYATFGKIHAANQLPEAAVQDFNAAIARRLSYEDYYHRGMTQLALGQSESGYLDLQQSRTLLPSSLVQDGLTLISEASKTKQWVLTQHPENEVEEIAD